MYHYLKLLTKRQQKIFFNEYSLEFDVKGLPSKNIERFRKLYRVSAEQDLPISYAFIAGFKPMMKALSHKHFAFSPLGLIHLTAEFKQFFMIDFQQHYKVVINIKQSRSHPLGKLVQIESKFYQGEKCCLINKNTMLKKLKATDRAPLTNQHSYTADTPFHVDSLIARAYAKVSYDYNPIHISERLAKLFGMPGAIIHGMYLAHLLLIEKKIVADRLKIEFKKPCLLATDIGISNNSEQWQIFSGLDQLHLNCKLLE
ncbi:MaoC/PaaZ C-terminal domain-containing protein [Thalassotalea sp. ND16A]|uniref:MaoC/PaaZ C-terminal domain-containing protein n=1 Tax=Thalassotalea sp. ND16A TaxID=1535422 RepID=UPI00051A0456|nr:MaoC/PaaZ C-terminal domain-containing protein [Thalassotalea sp. ND16A]KGJ98535.1 hypothetical protein ND16A_0605 [Thalassotalea sp. ND16A]